MGDRGNIYVHKGPEKGVYLYTHWSGSYLPKLLQDALRNGQSRWYDTPYLTRIIFDTLTGLEGGETGYGIDTVRTSDNHPLLAVDDDHGVVRVENGPTYTYQSFIELDAICWDVVKYSG